MSNEMPWHSWQQHASDAYRTGPGWHVRGALLAIIVRLVQALCFMHADLWPDLSSPYCFWQV